MINNIAVGAIIAAIGLAVIILALWKRTRIHLVTFERMLFLLMTGFIIGAVFGVLITVTQCGKFTCSTATELSAFSVVALCLIIMLPFAVIQLRTRNMHQYHGTKRWVIWMVVGSILIGLGVIVAIFGSNSALQQEKRLKEALEMPQTSI